MNRLILILMFVFNFNVNAMNLSGSQSSDDFQIKEILENIDLAEIKYKNKSYLEAKKLLYKAEELFVKCIKSTESDELCLIENLLP
ncbi:MAG: hypothetical protein ABIF12_01320 [bacterium]